MQDFLGEVSLDEKAGALLCKTRSRASRVRISSLMKKIVPGSTPRIDGNFLTLNLREAVSLLSRPTQVPLCWSEEAKCWVQNFASAYANRGRARRRIWQLQQEGVAEEVLSDYPALENLDPHQSVAVAAMTDPLITGLCLFDEQGVGKTVMTIHAFDRLRQLGEADILFVFAPKNMVEVWKSDFHKFFGESYSVVTITGSKNEKYDTLLSSADVYVTNYETAHLLEHPLRSFLLRHSGRTVLAVDESFYVKNCSTRRAGAIRRLRHLCTRCWVLCGTPAPNSAFDVIHQFDVADGGVTFSSVSLPKDQQALRRTIRETVERNGLYLRRLKKKVLPNLPGKKFERVSVPMEHRQQHLYMNALAQLVRDVQDTDEATFTRNLSSFIARRMVLFELCSHPSQIVPDYEGTPGKHAALDQLLDELISHQGEKVVLWSYFRYSLNELERRYQRFNPVRLDGTVSDTRERELAIERFQEDSTTMLFLANPAAGGAGITLTRSRLAVYESFPVQTAHYLQSLDRIHRRGQTRETFYYFLVCRDSIEEEEYERLLQKEQQALELFGDPEPDRVTRELFLHELLTALRKLS